MIESRTIVFIHGLFMNAKSWEKWIVYFEAMGYTCYAPSYPYRDEDPSVLRTTIHPMLKELSIGKIVQHYEEFINTLPEKPILIGHSVGGFLVQKLMELNKAELGVCKKLKKYT